MEFQLFIIGSIVIIATLIICLLWSQHLAHSISDIEKTLFSWTENQIAHYKITNAERLLDIHDKKLDTLYSLLMELTRKRDKDNPGQGE